MKYQKSWWVLIGLAMVASGCQLSLGVACGDGWCSDGQICSSPSSVHPVCILSSCGNGRKDPDEECDDEVIANSHCSLNCTLERCGNGVVDPGEECDGGAGLQPCSADCHQERCGNGFLDPGEECDDGNSINGDRCERDCKLPRCGNGIVDLGEQCDYGGRACGSCDASCQDVLNLGATGTMSLPDEDEPCFGGFVNLSDGHSVLPLTLNYPEISVGAINITLQNGESGAEIAQTIASLIEVNLQIDTRVIDNVIYMTNRQTGIIGNVVIYNNAPGANTSGMSGGQGSDCEIGSICRIDQDCEISSACIDNRCECASRDTNKTCGNGIVEVCEECDDGNRTDGDLCEHDCTLPRCGNGVIDLKESCDDGVANSDAGPCTPACRLATCGDGLLQAGEECDDGNHTDADGCESDCMLPKCGNAIFDPGEECDDGNQTDSDGCEHDCTLPRCGNGIVDPSESCDDGNQDACGSCNESCSGGGPANATSGNLLVGSGADLQIAPKGGGNNRFTLSDDYTNPDSAVTFEYTNGTPSIGHVAIPFLHDGMLDSTTMIAQGTAAAINASKLLIVAGAFNGDVFYINLRSTTHGNHLGMFKFGPKDFDLVSQMDGRSGNCDIAIGCALNSDCSSNLCVGSKCVACATSSECSSHLCGSDGACRPCKVDSDCISVGAGTSCSDSHICISE